MNKRYPYNLDLMTFGIVSAWTIRAAESLRDAIDRDILATVLRAARHSGPLNQNQKPITTGDSKPCR